VRRDFDGIKDLSAKHGWRVLKRRERERSREMFKQEFVLRSTLRPCITRVEEGLGV